MSDEQPKKPKITVSPRSVGTLDTDAIIRRRLEGDPRYTPAPEIPMREAGWYLKEANSYGDPNRHYQMVHSEGYVPFTTADLPEGITPTSLGWQVAEDGLTLCRGERGQERLYKMPQSARTAIEKRKTELNLKGQGSERAVREDAANAAAAVMGSEAGEFIHKNLRVTGSDSQGPLGR